MHSDPALAQGVADGAGFNPLEWFKNALGWINSRLLNVLEWIDSLGAIGGIAFIFLYIFATVALLPGSVITVGGGFVFGIFFGSLYVLIGATLGATAAFLVGRYLARGWVANKIAGNRKFAAIDRAVGREGLKIVFLTRLSPVFPFVFLNYAYGLTGVSLKDYFFASIGMLPGTIMYVYFGSLASDLATIGAGEQPENSAIKLIINIIAFIATVAVTLYVTKIAKKALDEEISQDQVADETI
ncbi:TVP38/TMEM64 family protein [Mastigocoleus sp. MO_188.B34]|uniref:TVP38/TMEM64 family protein n=1 Tax=Mastigocoleus sp. MO_188.B34 TaxID=3036635 RepID=UPI00262A8C1A|nr:TVP38/TMEM64 family protein [Mastigocoleus sp. MO_188.B34]MDJ0697197.1 TVP38/TMEM64 family protein [Mastigocoleus sp. MO_188.B34]